MNEAQKYSLQVIVKNTFINLQNYPNFFNFIICGWNFKIPLSVKCQIKSWKLVRIKINNAIFILELLISDLFLIHFISKIIFPHPSKLFVSFYIFFLAKCCLWDNLAINQQKYVPINSGYYLFIFLIWKHYRRISL